MSEDSKLKQFLNTTKNVIKTAATTGKLMADQNLTKVRREICSNCEHQINNRCQKCGCFIGAKTSIHAANCPIRRW